MSSQKKKATASPKVPASPKAADEPLTEADWRFVAQPSALQGRAVILAATMKKLRLAVNDIVIIKSRQRGRLCAARAWPTQKHGAKHIGLDRATCNVLQLEYNEEIVLAKSDLPSASRVLIRCADLEQNISHHTRLYIAQSLVGMALTRGEAVPLSVFGKMRNLCVAEAHDATGQKIGGPFIVGQSSDVAVITSEESAPSWSVFEKSAGLTAAVGGVEFGIKGVGGMKEIVSQLGEVVEMAIFNREMIRGYGTQPPVGVLLHGPSGTGKTTLARCVASSLSISLVTLDASEIVGKFYGESESKMSESFAAAVQAAPSILFIDEIDTLCPQMSESAATNTEHRLLSSLLGQLDSLAKNSHPVLVVAATNRPESIDPSLRRFGRLDLDLYVGVPTTEGRREIFNILLSEVPNDLSEGDIDRFAADMHGYVGADIKAVVSEATMTSLRRIGFSVEGMANASISANDVEFALSRVAPSALREMSVEVPRVYWEDIGGNAEAKSVLNEIVVWPLMYPEAFVRLGIRPPRGVLLYGPPGCSKTLMAKALATEVKLNFIAVKGPELLRKWVGESEKAVRTLFQKARSASPCIIFFDEIDSLAGTRGKDTGAVERVVSQLLSEMDGIEPLKNVIVLAATNRPDIIDPALLRPGRLDRLMYIGPPDADSRHKIFSIHTRKMPLADDVDLAALAQRTDKFSGAEVAHVCREAALSAMQENVDIPFVSMCHFETALSRVSPSISQQTLDFYLNFQSTRGVS